MGLFSRMMGREKRDSLENPSTSLVAAMTGSDGLGAVSGVNVSPRRALGLTGVYAAVRVIAEGVAQLPLPIYERNGRSRERAPDDSRWSLLNDFPNPEMTAAELHETTVGHACLWGKGYEYLERDGTGQVSARWPLHPERTRQVRLESGQLAFVTTLDSGEQRALPARDVLVLRAFLGLSPIELAKETLGLAIAAEEYGGRYFANDGRPGGLIETDADMDSDGVKEFRQAWDAGHRGLKRSHLVGILTNGAKWKDVGAPPATAQFLETRKFEVQEIARLFRVPASMIEADKGGSLTYSTVEGDLLYLVTHTLQPWLVRYEQALKRSIFSLRKDRQRGLYPEFLIEHLLRGDTLTRYTAYGLALQGRWMTRAEVRERENLPFRDGLDEFDEPAAGAEADLTDAVRKALLKIGQRNAVPPELNGR